MTNEDRAQKFQEAIRAAQELYGMTLIIEMQQINLGQLGIVYQPVIKAQGVKDWIDQTGKKPSE